VSNLKETTMNLFENLVKAIDVTKYIVGSIIIVLCIVIIIIGISGSYNSAALGGPEIEFLLLVGFLLLLACNEGFQVGILGIEHFCNKSIEERECPRTAKIHRIMFTTNGSKLKQLLIGQSFLVVLSSFIIAKLITFPTFPDVEGEILLIILQHQYILNLSLVSLEVVKSLHIVPHFLR
jgi:hypothetical protein